MEPTQTYHRHRIANVHGYTLPQLLHEIEQGGQFVVFDYGVGLVGMYIDQTSRAHYVRPGESPLRYSWFYIMLNMLFGWWYPSGPVRTARKISQCRRGGTEVTYDILSGLTETSLRMGMVEVRKAAQVFKKLPRKEYHPIVDKLGPVLDKYPEIDEIYIGLYIHPEDDEPWYYIGYSPIADHKIFEYEARKALQHVLMPHALDTTLMEFLGDDDISLLLRKQGQTLDHRELLV